MQSLLAGLTIVTAARGFAVDRHEFELVWPALCDPGRKAVHEQVRINPIHHRAQPIGTGNPEVELGESPQERQVRLSPVNDVVIVVAIRDRPAHHQEQHLAQRIGDLPGLTRVLDLGKVIEQKPQPWLG